MCLYAQCVYIYMYYTVQDLSINFAIFLIVITAQDYAEEGSHNRYLLNYFHRRVRRDNFDVERYIYM